MFNKVRVLGMGCQFMIDLSQRQCCLVIIGLGQDGVQCRKELEIGGEPVQGVEFILGYPFCAQVFV